MVKDNQMKRVKEWLEEGKTLTSMQAYDMWGCTRMSDKVFKLRKHGMDIETVMLTRKNRFGDTCNYAEYVYKKPSKSDCNNN